MWVVCICRLALDPLSPDGLAGLIVAIPLDLREISPPFLLSNIDPSLTTTTTTSPLPWPNMSDIKKDEKDDTSVSVNVLNSDGQREYPIDDDKRPFDDNLEAPRGVSVATSHCDRTYQHPSFGLNISLSIPSRSQGDVHKAAIESGTSHPIC